jgi:hypothetical protein
MNQQGHHVTRAQFEQNIAANFARRSSLPISLRCWLRDSHGTFKRTPKLCRASSSFCLAIHGREPYEYRSRSNRRIPIPSDQKLCVGVYVCCVGERAILTTIKMGLSDDQAAALRAKAAGEGLSLEDWFRRLADREVRPRKRRYVLTELVEQCDPQAPLSEEDREWLGSGAIDRNDP